LHADCATGIGYNRASHTYEYLTLAHYLFMMNIINVVGFWLTTSTIKSHHLSRVPCTEALKVHTTRPTSSNISERLAFRALGRNTQRSKRRRFACHPTHKSCIVRPHLWNLRQQNSKPTMASSPNSVWRRSKQQDLTHVSETASKSSALGRIEDNGSSFPHCSAANGTIR
jgi:hypothetical protein